MKQFLYRTLCGFVLGISFIAGCALIIYYKQLSEGAQDQRDYRILQEIGLSKAEVARTIRSQVKLIFFLPLVVAVIHFAFAYVMLSKIIGLFGITDTNLILSVSALVIGAVGLLYFLIYKLTSQTYYRIVER